MQRLRRSADFARVLSMRPCARTGHFALHHMGGPCADELSTAAAPRAYTIVDDSLSAGGVVVAKRHAKRAVTRSLIKRQARQALARHAAALRPGLWVVRLRAGFDERGQRSAASDALRSAVRSELEQLLGDARRVIGAQAA